MKRLILPILLTLSAVVPASMYAKTPKPVTLSDAVRHSLSMMSHFSVFDDLKFQVSGSTVVLNGQVTNPTVKDDAEYAALHVEGVTSVVNNIEVLPVSPDDDRIRLAVYKAIYGTPSLALHYGSPASAPVHIIVKDGVVRLEGVVLNNMDRTMIGMRAQGVFGAFKVENDLQVAS